MRNIIVFYVVGKDIGVYGAYSISKDWGRYEIEGFVRHLNTKIDSMLRPMRWIDAPKEFKKVEESYIIQE